MTIRITDDDMATVLSELTAHKNQPVNHPDCEYCDWVKDFIKTGHGEAFAEESGNSTEYLDRLFFLFAGVRIGRKQGVDDMITDISTYGVQHTPLDEDDVFNMEVEEATASPEPEKTDFEFGGGESGGGGAGGDF